MRKEYMRNPEVKYNTVRFASIQIGDYLPNTLLLFVPNRDVNVLLLLLKWKNKDFYVIGYWL